MTDISYSSIDYLLQLSCGYWKSQVLFVAIEFKIFTLLKNTRLTAKEVSQSLHTNERATEILLNALVSLDLLAKQKDFYRNASLSESYLVKGSPYYQGDAIHHFHNIMENWTMLKETIETGKAVSLKDLPEDVDPHGLRDFITAMHNIASVKAEELCNAVDVNGSEYLLDVAGGPGVYSITLAKKHPHLQAVVYDLENVTHLTREFIEKAGMKDRIRTQAGNCLEDEFDKNTYDLILISNLLHIYNPANNKKILKKCWHALKDNGQVIIHEFVLDETATYPQFAALFGLNMLIGTQEGAVYRESEYKAWLEDTGFQYGKRIDLKSDSSLIFGRK
ncbi:MAG: acetylserotonin O-methyltransferase [Candidatus Brocadiaceae bacterium]|nr:acetylserotonin O-methyltransferase [Candidatus Brocadiaceae bacterium]